jgi:exodeoxyribonuclease VII large subunit
LRGLFVVGEISNFNRHYKSGHMYLSLKDGGALIKAVMIKTAAEKLRFTPRDGLRVICRGRVSLYERDGAYQLYIDDMQPDGVGALALSFEQLCERLRAEGLFDESKKRPIPKYPGRIAVITSAGGAALQDILSVLRRRFPITQVIVCPVDVQGANAASQVVNMLDSVNRQGAADVIIVGRGGGAVEEIWAFNDERLAYALRRSKIPVISAVGHETDFTVCDFAADLRAPTPTAAAELATPSALETAALLNRLRQRVSAAVLGQIAARRAVLTALTVRRSLSSPRFFIESRAARLESTRRRLSSSMLRLSERKWKRLAPLAAKLDAISPLKLLSRGYAAAVKDGRIVTSAKELIIGDKLNLRFADGQVECEVSEQAH